MIALSEYARSTLKDVGLICAAIIGLAAVCGLIVKFIKQSLAKAASWIDEILTVKLKPIQEALDKNAKIHKSVVAILEEIHKGTAELLPNGGTKLYDKIDELHKNMGSSKES